MLWAPAFHFSLLPDSVHRDFLVMMDCFPRNCKSKETLLSSAFCQALSHSDETNDERTRLVDSRAGTRAWIVWLLYSEGVFWNSRSPGMGRLSWKYDWNKQMPLRCLAWHPIISISDFPLSVSCLFFSCRCKSPSASLLKRHMWLHLRPT